jgi:hypothetical protein
LTDDLGDVLGVMTVAEQIRDGPFLRRRRKAVDQGDVSLGEVPTMHANASPGLLALRVGDLRYVIEEVAELVQTRSRCVRDHAGAYGVGEPFLGCPGRVESEPSSTGDENMRLYVVYAPVHHTPGIVQKTSDDAEKDEESERDKPPAWSVQPQNTEPDKKA